MTDTTTAVLNLVREAAEPLGVSVVSLRVPTDPTLPMIRVDPVLGPVRGPGVRPITVIAQVYAADDGTASRIAEGLWSSLDGTYTDDLPSVDGLTPPMPYTDPDRPELRRWQLTLTAVHST